MIVARIVRALHNSCLQLSEVAGCDEPPIHPAIPIAPPDLEGLLAPDRLLCEVKTINISEEEVAFRTGRKKVRSGQITIPAQFLKKLCTTVDDAKQQLLAFGPTGAAVVSVGPGATLSISLLDRSAGPSQKGDAT